MRDKEKYFVRICNAQGAVLEETTHSRLTWAKLRVSDYAYPRELDVQIYRQGEMLLVKRLGRVRWEPADRYYSTTMRAA